MLFQGKKLILAEFRPQLERAKRLLLGQDSCHFGVEFHTLDSLAKAVAEEVPGHHWQLSPMEERQMLRGILYDVVDQHQLPVVWKTEGCLNEIALAIHDLSLQGQPLPPKEPALKSNATSSEVLAVVRNQYEQALAAKSNPHGAGTGAKVLDSAGIRRNLIDLLRTPASRTLPLVLRRLEGVELIGFGQPEAWQQAAIEALTAWLGKDKVKRMFPLPDCPFVASELEAVMGGDRDKIAAIMRDDSPQPELPAGLEIVQCPDGETELRHLARRLRSLLADSANSPEEILVVTAADPGLRERLGTVLDAYEIPHDAAVGLNVADSPLGEFVLRLVEMNPEKLAWTDLLWLVSSPFVVRSGLWGADKPLSLRALARMLRSFKLRAGSWAEWRGCLDRLIKLWQVRLQALTEDEAGSSEEQLRVERTLEKLERCRKPFAELLKNLESLLGEKESRSVPAWAAWLHDALGKDGLQTAKKSGMRRGRLANADPKDGSLFADVKLLNREQAAQGALLELLNEAKRQPATDMSRREFAEWLRWGLASGGQGELFPWTAAVNVRAPEQVEAGAWKYCFIFGLNEGCLPGEVKDAGLFPDTMREALGLKTTVEANATAAACFFDALRTLPDSGQLTLSYALADSQGRAIRPAKILQRLDDARAIWNKKSDGSLERRSDLLPDKLGNHRVTVLEPKDILPNTHSATTPWEAELANGLYGLQTPEEGLRLQEWMTPARWLAGQNEFTEFGAIPIDNGFLPSQLDQFGYCPYRYFAQCILGVKSLQEPDLVPDAMEIGTALHDALETAVAQALQDDARGSSWFVSSSKDEKLARIEIFKHDFRDALETEFEKLSDKGMALDGHVIAMLRRRWQQTVENVLPKTLFKLEFAASGLPEKWDETCKAIREKAAVPVKNMAFNKLALALLPLYETAWAQGHRQPPETGGKYPRGFTDPFKDLNKIMVERANHLSDLSIPVQCEWEFATREDPLKVDLGEGESVRLRGKIDRVDLTCGDGIPKVRIFDYKTSKHLNRAKDIVDGIDLQLPAYALAFEAACQRNRLPETMPPGAALDAVRLVSLRGHNDQSVSTQDYDLLNTARVSVRKAKEHIETGKLAPAPRKDCPLKDNGYCDYAELCRGRLIPEEWYEQGYSDDDREKAEDFNAGGVSE
jgi:RecB family exonuclease